MSASGAAAAAAAAASQFGEPVLAATGNGPSPPSHYFVTSGGVAPPPVSGCGPQSTFTSLTAPPSSRNEAAEFAQVVHFHLAARQPAAAPSGAHHLHHQVDYADYYQPGQPAQPHYEPLSVDAKCGIQMAAAGEPHNWHQQPQQQTQYWPAEQQVAPTSSATNPIDRYLCSAAPSVWGGGPQQQQQQSVSSYGGGASIAAAAQHYAAAPAAVAAYQQHTQPAQIAQVQPPQQQQHLQHHQTPQQQSAAQPICHQIEQYSNHNQQRQSHFAANSQAAYAQVQPMQTACAAPVERVDGRTRQQQTEPPLNKRKVAAAQNTAATTYRPPAAGQTTTAAATPQRRQSSASANSKSKQSGSGSGASASTATKLAVRSLLSQNTELPGGGCNTRPSQLQQGSGLTLGAGAGFSASLAPCELEDFAERFKQRRIKLGVTQADVGKALATLQLPGVGSLSQSTICRFESLTLSHNNMIALRPILQAWLETAENQARQVRSAQQQQQQQLAHWQQLESLSSSSSSSSPQVCASAAVRLSLQPQQSGKLIQQAAAIGGGGNSSAAPQTNHQQQQLQQQPQVATRCNAPPPSGQEVAQSKQVMTPPAISHVCSGSNFKGDTAKRAPPPLQPLTLPPQQQRKLQEDRPYEDSTSSSSNFDGQVAPPVAAKSSLATVPSSPSSSSSPSSTASVGGCEEESSLSSSVVCYDDNYCFSGDDGADEKTPPGNSNSKRNQPLGCRTESQSPAPHDKTPRRTSIAARERHLLETHFDQFSRPTSEQLKQIAEKLDMDKSTVRVWFCNQRQKQKRLKYSANQVSVASDQPPSFAQLTSNVVEIETSNNMATPAQAAPHEEVGEEEEEASCELQHESCDVTTNNRMGFTNQ